jgi:uncharacterized phage-associated protein
MAWNKYPQSGSFTLFGGKTTLAATICGLFSSLATAWQHFPALAPHVHADYACFMAKQSNLIQKKITSETVGTTNTNSGEGDTRLKILSPNTTMWLSFNPGWVSF